MPGGYVYWREQWRTSNHLISWSSGQPGWQVLKPMNQFRQQHCVATDGDDLIWVIGGLAGTSNSDRMNGVEQYSISSGVWTTKAPLSFRALSRHGCTYTQRHIFVSGGFYSIGSDINKHMYVYNVEADSWSISEHELAQPLYGHIMVS